MREERKAAIRLAVERWVLRQARNILWRADEWIHKHEIEVRNSPDMHPEIGGADPVRGAEVYPHRAAFTSQFELLADSEGEPRRPAGRRRPLWLVVLALLAGILPMASCAGDEPDAANPVRKFVQMELVTIEGEETDQWEIWRDTVSHTRILCHHSGFTGSSGGRSTSCVTVSEGVR
jgi:hypothetical protein